MLWPPARTRGVCPSTGVGVEELASAPESRVGGRTLETRPSDNRAMLELLPRRRRSLSCGIVVLLDARELLLCHVTGQRHWDLPKGGIQLGESTREAALRETDEETGLVFAADRLLELGRHAYTAKKDLHLFACLSARIDASDLHCESSFVERLSGRVRPEMDGFGWFGFDRIGALCTPKLAHVLTARLDLDGIVEQLVAGDRQPLAA
jgi:8-oxo-dGTP pyrophosphatase MutT (NUDIX family)